MSHGSAAHLVDIYAQSLLDLAEQSEIVDAVEADMEAVADLLAQQPSFQAFLASPYFAEQTKRDLISRVFTDKLNRLTLNFLSVVIDHGRGTLLPEILDRYQQLYRVIRGYKTVTVTVAQPLNKDYAAKLTQDLAEAMHAKVDLDVHVDPSILGGAVFRYGDKMLDNSVRGRLVRTVRRITHPEGRHQSL